MTGESNPFIEKPELVADVLSVQRTGKETDRNSAEITRVMDNKPMLEAMLPKSKPNKTVYSSERLTNEAEIGRLYDKIDQLRATMHKVEIDEFLSIETKEAEVALIKEEIAVITNRLKELGEEINE